MNPIRIIVLSCVCTVSCATTTLNDKVGNNLSYLINPVSESSAGFLGARKIAACVSEKSKNLIPIDSYPDFSAELESYVVQLEQYIESASTNGFTASEFPAYSESLDSYLELLVPAVYSCESIVGVNVEF